MSLNYSAQGRAVTTSDYEVYVKRLFQYTISFYMGWKDGSFDQDRRKFYTRIW